MSFVAPDEIGGICHRKCGRRWVAAESSLVANPLNERFNVAFGTREESNLPLDNR
jgi:hypothetical protein